MMEIAIKQIIFFIFYRFKMLTKVLIFVFVLMSFRAKFPIEIKIVGGSNFNIIKIANGQRITGNRYQNFIIDFGRIKLCPANEIIAIYSVDDNFKQFTGFHCI